MKTATLLCLKSLSLVHRHQYKGCPLSCLSGTAGIFTAVWVVEGGMFSIRKEKKEGQEEMSRDMGFMI